MDPAGIFATSFARDTALVRTRPQQIALALFLIFLLALPILFGPRLLAISTLILISSVIVLGLQVTTGYAGQINLGQAAFMGRSEEHTSELQSRLHLVCRLLL